MTVRLADFDKQQMLNAVPAREKQDPLVPSLVVSDIFFFFFFLYFFFFKQKTAYEISACLVGSEMCIRDRRR